MKNIIFSIMLVCLSFVSYAKTNEGFIRSMSQIDRMVACSIAHEGWQNNAPTSEQAENHRVISSKVWDNAFQKFGGRVFSSMVKPEVMAMKVISMNRESLSLEKNLCDGFYENIKFTLTDSTHVPNADEAPLTIEQHGIRRKVKTFTHISQFYDYMLEGSRTSEPVRLYMCYSAYSGDEVGREYEKVLDETMGGVKEVEFVVTDLPVFKQFFKHAIYSHQGQFIDNFCRDFSGSV